MNNPELIARFVTYLRAERGASKNTVASYELDLSKFAAWLETPLQDTKRTDVQKYISQLLADGRSGRSAARNLSCLRTFYHFLIDEGDITHDPTRNLPVPKSWKTLPKSLSQSDLDLMVSSLGSSRLEVRDKAMLLLFFGSGLREGELADLKLHDLDLESGVVKIWNGKGGKDGIVPLSPPAVAALRHYLESVRPRFDRRGGSNLFLGFYGRSLTRQQVYYRVQRAAQEALGKCVSPHQLRHGFATVLVEGGADIRDVQVLMRHSSVDTTQIYVHLDLTYLRRIYYASHPRARIAAA